MEDPDDRDFVVGVGVCYGGSDGNVMVMKWKMVVMKAKMEGSPKRVQPKPPPRPSQLAAVDNAVKLDKVPLLM